MLSNLPRYYHTAKHLKAIQLLAIAQKPLKSPVAPKHRSLKTTPRIHASKDWKKGIATPGFFRSPNVFAFLNKSQSIDIERDWSSSDQSDLWSFNLHYFHYLFQPDCSEKEGLTVIKAWISNAHTSIAWHPYPTSLRIVNWIRYHLEICKLPEEVIESLWHQIDHLRRNLETHLLANHYFANAKALLFASLFIENEDSEKWFNKATSILQNQLDEQFLEDGGHFERSPMYHRALTLDLLDILNALNSNALNRNTDALLAKILTKIPTALTWIQEIAHKEDIFPLFGDSAYGIVPSDKDLFDYANRLNINIPRIKHENVKHFPNSGFVIAKKGNIKLIADVGSIVADYQPGHAHADLLGFECSIEGERVFIDTGVDRYTPGKERIRQRSSGAHCSLTVDGKNSNEVWASFRVARRGRTSKARIEINSAETTVECSHDGFKTQSVAGIHHRQWRLKKNKLVICDEVRVKNSCYIEMHFIIHPNFKVDNPKKGTFVLYKKNDEETASATLKHSTLLNGTSEPIPICLEFGIQQMGTRITISDRANGVFQHSTQIEFYSST